MNTGHFEILKAATAEARAIYTVRAEQLYMTGLRDMREALAAKGWDLYKVAPYPDSYGPNFRGTKQYRIDLAKHHRYTANFENAPGLGSYHDYSRGKTPWLVVEKPDAEAKVRAAARADANMTFDSFLWKMVGKIKANLAPDDVVEGATFSGIIWDGCTLRIQIRGKHVKFVKIEQVWNTKCILNQSVYGKLFNQWPTRRES